MASHDHGNNGGVYAVAILVVIALVSLLISRVATVALTVTGIPRPVARFQARSALTGVGFTTSEAESIVGHPVRRRITMTLMLVGNLGLATVIASLLGGFLLADARQGTTRLLLLIGALAGVYWLSRSDAFDRHLSRLIERLLRRYTDLEIANVDRLLRLSGEFSVREVAVGGEGWLTEAPLGELQLRDEGVALLGVCRQDGSFVGVPDGRTQLEEGDTVIIYGADDAVAAVCRREPGKAGWREHEEAVEQFQQRH